MNYRVLKEYPLNIFNNLLYNKQKEQQYINRKYNGNYSERKAHNMNRAKTYYIRQKCTKG